MDTITAGEPTSRGLVLLVEDEALSSEVLKLYLEDENYRVEVAYTVRDAVRRVEDKRFDLIISDISLPDGNGLDLIEKIKKLYPVKAIALSGRSFAEDIAASKARGFDMHIVKPTDPETVTAHVNRLLQVAPES